jgi:hypothetical protein
LLTFAGNVACWGGLGHRTVGYLAEHYFTDDAAQFVKDLIKPTDSFDISDAAIWADGIRQRQHFTEGWHFIGETPRTTLRSSVIWTLPGTVSRRRAVWSRL